MICLRPDLVHLGGKKINDKYTVILERDDRGRGNGVLRTLRTFLFRPPTFQVEMVFTYFRFGRNF